MIKKVFAGKNLLHKVRFPYSLLVSLVLAILLLMPNSALALDNSSTTVQSYLSNFRIELDKVLTDIKKLPSLSYENGQATLKDIDNQLDKIKSDASKNSGEFQRLSNEAQQTYEYVLKLDSLEQKAVDKRRVILQETSSGIPEVWSQVNLRRDNLFLRYEQNQPEPVRSYASELRDIEKNIALIGKQLSNLSPQDYQNSLLLKDLERQAWQKRLDIMQLTVSEEYWPLIDLSRDDLFLRYQYNQPEPVRSYAWELRKIESDIRTVKEKLKGSKLDKQNLARAVTLADRVSKLSDNLEKRVELARQKTSNVKDYAEVLKSFNDPDILAEINDLSQFVNDLTNNLPNSLN